MGFSSTSSSWNVPLSLISIMAFESQGSNCLRNPDNPLLSSEWYGSCSLIRLLIPVRQDIVRRNGACAMAIVVEPRSVDVGTENPAPCLVPNRSRISKSPMFVTRPHPKRLTDPQTPHSHPSRAPQLAHCSRGMSGLARARPGRPIPG